MGWNRVKLILAAVLLCANLVLFGLIQSQARSSDYIPDEAVKRLLTLLEKDGISVIDDALKTKRQTMVIYGGDMGDTYFTDAAKALSGSKVSLSFTAPGGETYTMENGDRCAFDGGFSLRYEARDLSERVGDVAFSALDPANVSALATVTEVAARDVWPVERTVSRFFERVNGALDRSLQNGILFDRQGCFYDGNTGVYYYVCTQRLRETPVTNLCAVLAVYENEVIGMKGEWCLSPVDTTYSAQLYDQVNILYRVKDRIAEDSASERIAVTSLSLAYVVHYHADGSRYYFLPAWCVTTDEGASYMLNAVNGAFYTN